jgi:hypothetical protein
MAFRKSEPRKKLMFEITPKHCSLAEGAQTDPCRCVIAQAFYDKFGENLASIQVLPTRTTLSFIDGRIHKYKTPQMLRDALTEFDATKHWKLPEGVYFLLPIPKTQRASRKREESRKRRAAGDPAYNVKYELTGRGRPRQLNPRNITLRNMRKSALDMDSPPPDDNVNDVASNEVIDTSLDHHSE